MSWISGAPEGHRYSSPWQRSLRPTPWVNRPQIYSPFSCFAPAQAGAKQEKGRLHYRIGTQGAATLCPGLLSFCPFGAQSRRDAPRMDSMENSPAFQRKSVEKMLSFFVPRPRPSSSVLLLSRTSKAENRLLGNFKYLWLGLRLRNTGDAPHRSRTSIHVSRVRPVSLSRKLSRWLPLWRRAMDRPCSIRICRVSQCHSAFDAPPAFK